MSPDERVIKEIEDEVKKRFNPYTQGVWFKGIDIREISMPEEIEKEVIRRWTARVDRELRVEAAMADRDAMIAWSEGRAKAFEQLRDAKVDAWTEVARNVIDILRLLEKAGRKEAALDFVSAVQSITQWIAQDESIAVRYIEAMQSVIQTPGPKGIIITPPTPSPGFMPTPPQPGLLTGLTTGTQEQKKK